MMMAEGQGDRAVKNAEMPCKTKPPGWVVAELIPQSLKKRLNWLQNTVMALTQFRTDKPEPEPKP